MATLEKTRLHLVDALRGLAVIVMVWYHLMWDLVYIYGVSAPWFMDERGFILQRSIRWSFLLISGFCFRLGGRKYRRGLLTLGCSVVITLVTLVTLPKTPIHFGVLTLIGSATILTALLDKLLEKWDPWLGLGLSLALFLLTVELEIGRIGFCGLFSVAAPGWLYRDMVTAFLGFPAKGFVSSDYVPLIPWLFVFWMGYFSFRLAERGGLLRYLTRPRIPVLDWIGRRSLWIYMAHQPVLYGILWVLDLILKIER